jgi:DNA-directed RNA polymerase specialized sigma24 family protein
MSKAQLVAQHVPYLRRYARALVGSQTSGDAYVAAALEALVRDPGTIDETENLRVVLFRLLSKIWNSVPVNGTTDQVIDLFAGERNLGSIAAMPRQAFLLVSVEGFSEKDAAQILEVTEADFKVLVDDAGREMARQIATDVLIIEDETLIAMDLQQVVARLGHRVIGIARTRSEALACARSEDPGLILADIQLADGSSGLDAVNDLLDTFEVPVIFITAYPERFLTGERPEPAFLLSKPYQPSTVSALISQALFFERKAIKPSKRAAAG